MGLEVFNRLLDRYEVAGIEQGGFDITYTVWDTLREKPVRIRTIPDHLWARANRRIVERFRSVYGLWASLPKHKNVLSAYSVQEIEGRPYLFLGYFSGINLRRSLRETPFNLERIIHIAAQVCEGMDCIFRKKRVVHRDIKSTNILIDSDDNVKITGFDLALIANNQEGDDKEGPCGTLPYMSPEHFNAPEKVDNRSDIYSFGCVLYEMLTGRIPFRAQGYDAKAFSHMHLNEIPQRPSELVPLIPETLDTIVMKCLEKKPEDRFQNFGELKRALRSISKQRKK